MYKITNIKTNSMFAILAIATIFVSFLPLVLFILNKTTGFYLKDPTIPLIGFILFLLLGIFMYYLNKHDKKSFENNTFLIDGTSLGFSQFRINRRKIPILHFEYEFEGLKYKSTNFLVPYEFLETGKPLQILVKKDNPKKALVYNGYAPR